MQLPALFTKHELKDLYHPSDDVHPSKLGHRLIAGAITQAIAAVKNAPN